MQEDSDYTWKVLVLGESQVGKSSILNQLIENKFSRQLPPTLGIDYKQIVFQLKN